MSRDIEIQEIDDAACDACYLRRSRVVHVGVGGTTYAHGAVFLLCHRCRKRLAAMLLDRATWFKPTPLKRGEVALA